jgi:1-acyl-sn-glycerol-3-phosphate acyltransferase
MVTHVEPPSVAPAPESPPEASAQPARADGLVAAVVRAEAAPLGALTLVADLDPATVARLRRDALTLLARHGSPVTVELRFVATPAAMALIAPLDRLAARGVRVVTRPVRPGAGTGRAAPSPAPAESAAGPDPFGLDPAYRAGWVPPLRFLFERYWRVEVSGIEHVPATGGALVVANHSGAVPADAFMLATALELRHAARRRLRVLYDKFVDALPWIGPIYGRLGGVPASLANAEMMLRRGEVVALFPEGIAGVEKRWTERYRLRPFKTGTARLSLRTGSPVIPVAIVGAEEAYPVVTCLYRAGNVVGLPWIPVTPLFPLCGVAGALPLPTKWRMRFCPPVHPPAITARDDEDLVRELTARVRATIDAALRDLLASRSGIFL